jgi:hypothetical protein
VVRNVAIGLRLVPNSKPVLEQTLELEKGDPTAIARTLVDRTVAKSGNVK